MKGGKNVLYLVLALCLSGGFFAPGGEAGNFGVEQVVLVLWHGLELDQIENLRCSGPAAWGLMNTRSGGGEAVSGAYLSLGAGARAVGADGAASFFQNDRISAEFSLNTGLQPTKIVLPNIALIHQAQNVNYTVSIGALGTACCQKGADVAVFGSSDGPQKARWAGTVGMDAFGRVPEGNINGGVIIEDAGYPFGIRTDYGLLKEEVLKAPQPLVIVDLGDPYRFGQYQKFLLPEQKALLKARLGAEARAFVRALVNEQSKQRITFVISPYPDQKRAERGLWLTPAACFGLGEGVLISATTRWPGLITNMDIAPTILDLLGIRHEQSFFGRRAAIEKHPQPRVLVNETLEKLEKLSSRRGLILRIVIMLQILLYTASLIFLIITRPLLVQSPRVLQSLLLLFLAAPLAFMLWPASFLLVPALFAGISVLDVRIREPLLKVGIIAAATAAVVMWDVCTGSRLMRYSYLGYDPIGGARFYGIGNELMGILVGSVIIAWAVLRQKIKPSAYADAAGLLVFTAALIIIGAPSLGTNVGGTLCAVFAFGFAWLLFRGKKIKRRTVLMLALAAAVAVGILILKDRANPVGEQSHIGRTAALFHRHGLESLRQIIERKLAMNLKLLRSSIWSKALIVAAAVMGASFIWPSRFICWLKTNYPFIAGGIAATVAGSAAAFAFNDSGVVAAATCLYFGSTTLLLLALELKHNLNAPQTDV